MGEQWESKGPGPRVSEKVSGEDGGEGVLRGAGCHASCKAKAYQPSPDHKGCFSGCLSLQARFSGKGSDLLIPFLSSVMCHFPGGREWTPARAVSAWS